MQELVNLVANLPHNLTEQESFYYEFELESLPKEVKELVVIKDPSIDYIFWGHQKQWMSGELRPELLYEKIKAKNEIALGSNYYQNYSENWLLLVIENEPHSSFAGFSHDGYTLDESWIFDKVFIMEPKWDKELYIIEK